MDITESFRQRCLGQLKFQAERWIQRGVLHQLLLMASVIVLIALVGGIAATLTTDKFTSVFDAVWWAFLRLTDPGYLGDDEGVALRTISTGVTILGYVVFMGSLIAILTQWLARTIRRLESGLTPISMQNHVIILGWTNRTPEIVLKLLSGRGRLIRFLERNDVSKLRVVVLADDVTAERRQELRAYLGEYWNESQVFLRSGSSLHPADLERLDPRRAAAIVVPGSDFELGGAGLTDTRIVKTLLTLHDLLTGLESDNRPHVVAEIFDPLKVPVAQSTLSEHLEIVASDRVISRLISQSVRHRGLSQVFLEILSHRQGNGIYVRSFPHLEGVRIDALSASFPRAVVLGVIGADDKGRRTKLNPGRGCRMGTGDLLVLLARSYGECEPETRRPEEPEETSEPSPIPLAGEARRHRVLVLGWSYKIRALLAELGACESEEFEVTAMSRVPISERQAFLDQTVYDASHVRLQHLEGDYSNLKDLESLTLESYDKILFLASALMENSEQADARTILGYVLFRSLLEGREARPEVLVELLDPDNSRLVQTGSDLALISPKVLSHMLAHVALRPELNAVFEALFSAGGMEITSRRIDDYGWSARSARFHEIQQVVASRGETALGVIVGSRDGLPRPVLNPDRAQILNLTPVDRFIVLADYAPRTERIAEGVPTGPV